jgi:hypothetical protein
MPVDYRPLIILVLLIITSIFLLFLKKWKIATVLVIAEALIVGIFTYNCLHPPANLLKPAEAGDPKAEFELSRWYTARRCFGQGEGDFDASWKWLHKSADANYPPALYTTGVLWKMGYFLPIPPQAEHVWLSTPHPDPIKGEALIDEALRLGFIPPSEEKFYYATVFCVPSRPIPASATTRE